MYVISGDDPDIRSKDLTLLAGGLYEEYKKLIFYFYLIMVQSLYDNFVAEVKTKVPKKSELVQMLSDLLHIERESVYRRLRGDVPFTLVEAFKVANKLGVSLDEAGNSADGVTPLYVELSMFRNANGIEYNKLEQVLETISKISHCPDSERGEALSSISPFLWSGYERIFRYFSFREAYQYAPPHEQVHYEDIQISPRLRTLQIGFGESLRNFKKTYYIWDSSIIAKLIKDIKYFESIRLIGSASVQELKEELRTFLTKLEEMAVTGRYDGTDNKFELYISNVDIDMSYTYFWSQNACVSTFLTFIVRSAVTLNKETCRSIKNWVKSLKRVSTLISEAGEKERILFFEKQHQILDTL